MPENHNVNIFHDVLVVETHKRVQTVVLSNFLGARIPITTQLDVSVWEELLESYWDKQLLQFITFGFPIGFNRDCALRHTVENNILLGNILTKCKHI